MTLVQCTQVGKFYGTAGARTVALDGIDLEVDEGESVAIVGPSGSGKSTLLQLIGALDEPDEGQIVVAGCNLASMPDARASRFRREEVGFVFQFFNLVPTLNALDNVALPAQLAGRSAAAAREEARVLLERVRLEDRGGDHPDALSGGQQQRVAIARALINSPRLILADEPTGALDRHSGDQVLELLHELVRERGSTLLMATHRAEARASTQRTVWIEDGRIVRDERE